MPSSLGSMMSASGKASKMGEWVAMINCELFFIRSFIKTINDSCLDGESAAFCHRQIVKQGRMSVIGRKRKVF